MKINFFAKKYFSLGLILLIVSGTFFIGHNVFALPGTDDIGVGVANILGHLLSAIISALGLILTVLIKILVWVCSQSNFIGSAAVSNGWKIVRDLCNMFFILILLIISFATMLRMPNYEWKKLLPKLLLMAILINFSKTICGLIIDAAQIIMLTFVNGFKAVGEGNLVSMLGLKEIYSIDAEATNVNTFTVFGSYLLALIYVLISLVVITTMVAVLVMRMVMLWIYIVLSPLAYLLAAFPAGQSYSQQWWKEFTNNVIVGPVLAFFIWLSFASATGLVSADINPTGVMLNAGITQAGSTDNMIKFIISIGMLLGGLMITQQIGGMAGSLAGKGMAAIQSGKGWAMKKGKEALVERGKIGASLALRGVGTAVGAIGGSKLAGKIPGGVGESIKKAGSFANQWGKDLHGNIRDEQIARRRKTLKKMGLGSGEGEGQEKLKEFAEDKNIKGIKRGATLVAAGALGGNLPFAIGGIAAGLLKAIKTKKGYTADTLEHFGKGKDVRDAEKEKKDAEEDRKKKKELVDSDANPEIERIEKQKSRTLEQIEKTRKAKIASLPQLGINSTIAERNQHKTAVKTINDTQDNKQKNVEEFSEKQKEATYRNHSIKHGLGKADDRLKLAGDDLEAKKEKRHPFQKGMEGVSKEMLGPNELTIKAVEKGTAENKANRELRENLTHDDLDFGQFKNTFYSQSGPTSGQNKLFDLLSNGTKESKSSMANMVKVLKTLEFKNLSNEEKSGVINLKQGVQSQIKGGKSVDRELVDALNKVNTA
ncbi:hypothetical protein KJ962_00210 [Patescibacteria group bacterium]|nr:hypothetical protein [Patescibacteria group bacterium]MBU2214381.1 hypothetical protein [Patescibacteria group bacterium]MBU2250373.1 hypothetical protein [Patescibacteria group bacterium]